MGFFAWIREGVRRAILMGVSDAVDEIGKRGASEDFGPQVALALRQSVALPMEAHQPQPAKISPPTGGRKRLGRSLDQLREKPAS